MAQRPTLAVVGTFLVVAAIFVGVFAVAERLDRARTASEFATASGAKLRGVAEAMAADLRFMRFLLTDFRALVSSGAADRPDYPKLVNDELQAFSQEISGSEQDLWFAACALLVPSGARATFEARARADVQPQFRIYELDAAGEQQEAEPGAEHLPLAAVLSESHPGALLGLDVASLSGIRQDLEAARDSGAIVATSLLSITEGTPKSVWLIGALYRTASPPGSTDDRRAAFRGYVIMGVRMDLVFDEALAGMRFTGIDLLLVDVSAGAQDSILAGHASRGHRAKIGLDELDRGMSLSPDRDSIELTVANRTWQVRAAAGPTFYTARGQWQAWAILGAGVLLAVLAAGLVRVSLARWRLVEGVVRQRTAELTREIEERARIEAQLRDAERVLTTRLEDLDRRNTEIDLLNQMAEMLQRCMTTQEALPVVRRFAALLFPGDDGELYLHPEGEDFVERAAAWGSGESRDQVFPLADCWALRSGKPHVAADPVNDLVCPHVGALGEGSVSLCVPLSAQGQVVGLMHLQGRAGASAGGVAAPTVARRDLAVTVAEQVSLAVANIRLREILREQSIRDPLTGLFNRRYMEESINQTLHRAQRSGKPLGVIMIDIDHFKRWNDEHGHDAGDAVLRALGEMLRGALRESDTACRYGGEEFVITMPDATPEVAAQRAERIRTLAHELRVSAGGAALGPISLSLGVAAYPSHGADRNSVLAAADRALYEAKAQGRDRVVIA